jgi:hypothetical protein
MSFIIKHCHCPYEYDLIKLYCVWQGIPFTDEGEQGNTLLITRGVPKAVVMVNNVIYAKGFFEFIDKHRAQGLVRI